MTEFMQTTDVAVQSSITGYWSRRADSYDAHHVWQMQNEAVRSAWADVWTGALPEPPARVLDVGTGTGHAPSVHSSRPAATRVLLVFAWVLRSPASR